MFVVQCKDEIQVFHDEENANALASTLYGNWSRKYCNH